MSLADDVRLDFPFLQPKEAQSKVWTYLDSAATTLKPRCVIETISAALTNHSSNIHRSVCGLSDVTTELFESARQRIARFLGAQAHEIVFVRNTTEAINMVARCFPRTGATLVSLGEHHSNLLPWRQGRSREVPTLPDGRPNLQAIQQELDKDDVSLVAISHISNITGYRTELRSLAEMAHRQGAVLVVDAAQSAGRLPIDVNEIDCDFLACSGHKMYGPTGIGLLFGKGHLLQQLQQYQFGGGTVKSVAQQSEWKDIPWRFEAGTPAIEAVLGWGSAVDYLQELGMPEVEQYERQLTELAFELLVPLPKCQIIGSKQSSDRLGVISFYLADESSHVIARTLSDRFGICVRSGNHCAQPFHDYLDIPPTLRISFGIYTTQDEIRFVVESIHQILKSAFWR